MRALDMKVVTEAEYRDAVVILIDTGLEFIAVSTDLLVSAISGVADHSLTPAFEKLASRLGGKKADMPSHFSVAFNTVDRIWNDLSLSRTLQQAVLGRLLERLITDRTMVEVKQIVDGFIERGGKFRGAFALYILDWLRGHFLVLR
jgi:hypothetical protein